MNVDEKRGREVTLAEIMSTEMVTLAPEDTLGDAVSILADRRISGAPVMSGLVVIGVLGGVSATMPLGMLLAKRARIIGTVLRSRPPKTSYAPGPVIGRLWTSLR
mgnify:CR=1 FL=1